MWRFQVVASFDGLEALTAALFVTFLRLKSGDEVPGINAARTQKKAPNRLRAWHKIDWVETKSKG
jgi:hypothetical protein